MAQDLDVNDDIERFKFNLQAYVVGLTIEAIIVSKDGVEIYLTGQKGIAFRPNGPNDLRIEIVIPPVQEQPPLMVV